MKATLLEDTPAASPLAAGRSAPGATWFAALNAPPSARFRLGIFALYLALLLLGNWSHAMWRDEIQAWLLVRDSASLGDLIHNLRYEGHPALWYLWLRPFSWLGRQPEWMQPAQVLAAASAVGLLLWKGPFSRLEAALLPFGFIFLFEYGIKSRGYGLGAALALLFAASIGLRRRRPEVVALILALLANVSVFSAIVAMAAAGALLVERIVQAARGTAGPMLRGRDLAAAVIVVAGLAAAFTTAWPAADSGFATPWTFDLAEWHIKVTLRALAALVFDWEQRWSATLAGLLVVAVAALRWRASPLAATFFLLSVAGILGFIHVKYGPMPWHRGALYVALVAAVWISRRVPEPDGAALLPRPLFALVLVAQAVYGLGALGHDLVTPYSNGRAIARFITDKGWAGAPLYALDDLTGSTVVGYLGIDHAQYAQGARPGSFVVWDKPRFGPVDVDAFLRTAKAAGGATVLVCSPGPQGDPTAFGFTEVARFEGSAQGEDCAVYRPATAP